MGKVIEVESLRWKYSGRDTYVLKDVNLHVEKGEFVGIVGPSGAGKTTLCLCFVGIIPQRIPGEFSGCVKVFGRSTTDVDTTELAKYVGLVFEDPETQFIMTTVEDELVIGLEMLNLPPEEIRERIRWALDIVGLPMEFLNRSPLDLSGGEKQRVAIASILARQPRILVLDEPTSDLDPRDKEGVLSAIVRIRKELDMTIVLVTHELDFLLKYADRVIVLSSGEIICEGEPREVFTRYYDVLKKIGVDVPEVVEISRALKVPPPRSSDELYWLVDDYLSKGLLEVEEVKSATEEITQQCSVGNEVVLRCVDVHHVYPPNIVALRGVSLEFRKGEYVALVGPNGSGKTTLAKILCGLLRPTRGDVLVKGVSVTKWRKRDLVKVVNYVFQNPDHQLFCRSVREEIEFGPRQLGLPSDVVERRVRELLEVFGLKGLENEHPFFLSKGERRRLALAATLALDPEVIIVDEPTTGQDRRTSREIMDLLKELRDRGHTVIVITHDIPLALEYVDRMVVLCNGMVIADGVPSEVLSREDIVEKAHLVIPCAMKVARALRKHGVLADVITTRELLKYLKPRRGSEEAMMNFPAA